MTVASGKELKALVSISGQVDPSLGKSISSASTSLKGFGKAARTVSKVAAAAVAATAAVAVATGKILIDLGTEFKEAENTIRIGTGATGKDLEGLYASMESVYKTVPTTLQDASSVIADYNTRLGLTGGELEGLSTQAIQVADMLGEDVSGVVESSSQAFQQWHIDADNMGSAMDYIFKVSQSTGVGFTDLMSDMQSYGAQLQEMGYTFEEASALMGQLDKAGVNTGEVLGAMKKSVTTMAKEGKSATEGLAEYYDAIKNAGTATEATAIASEVFGSRAASTMSAAIRDGKLDIEDLTEALKNSRETIGGAAEDTYTFADKWQLVKQNLQTAIEPIATSLVEGLESAMPYILEVVDDLKPQIEEFAQNMGPMIKDFAKKQLPLLADNMKNLATSVGDVITWIKDNWNIISRVGPILLVAALAAGPLASILGILGGALKIAGGGIGGFVGKLSNFGSTASSATPSISSAATSFGQMAGQALLLVAAGAAVMLIAGAMWILVQAATQLAAAGPAAVGVFILIAAVAVGVTAAIVAIGSAATVSAVGLIALGAAVLMVGIGIGIAAVAATLFCTQLPTIAQYGPTAASGIMMLTTAVTLFSGALLMLAGGLIADTASIAAFAAAAIAGTAGIATFGTTVGLAAAPAGLLLTALLGIQASVSAINSDATSAGNALKGMADSVTVVQSVLSGLGDLANGAKEKVLSMFQGTGSEMQADGVSIGVMFGNGVQSGLLSANTAMLAGFAVIKATVSSQIASLKAKFSNTSFRFNHHIAIPHFSMSGSFDAKSGKVPSVNVKWYRKGGFTDGLSIAGEDGMEAILSFNPAYRAQNLSYWAKAGKLLGVDSTILDLMTGKLASGGSTEINLGGVSFNPSITINGNASKDDVIAAIREEEPEFFDLLDRYLMMRGREAYGYN